MNENQPVETAAFIAAELRRRGAGVSPKIAILGMAFKGVPATNDLRGAMSLHVLDALKGEFPEAQISVFDSVATKEELSEVSQGARIAQSIVDAVAGANVVVIANNHPELGSRRPKALTAGMAPDAFIYDYWNHFSDLRPHELGNLYFAVGNVGQS